MAASGADLEIAAKKNNICSLCLKKQSKYTCPRCNAAYCSSECYKSEAHLQCSEAFYKDCVMDGLQDYTANTDDKTKVLEMLSRLEEENPVLNSDDDEEDEEEDLAERLENLDLDNDTDEIWDKLTSKEKAEFKAMLQDGRLGHLIEMWEPWWNQKKTSLVEEMSTDIAGPHRLSHPPLFREAPDISQVLKNGPPSPLIPYTLINVLYGYAYVARLHNGDHSDRPRQAAQELCELSSGLGNHKFNTTSEAVHACMQCLRNKTHKLHASQDFSVAILQDVISILKGPHQREPLTYILSSLSDVRQILRAAKKQIDKELKKPGVAREEAKTQSKQKLFAAQKKAEFLIGWTQKFGLQLQSLLAELELEFCALSTELSSHKRDQSRLEAAWKGKRPPKMQKFIEEITDR